jgi:hypothetical protein
LLAENRSGSRQREDHADGDLIVGEGGIERGAEQDCQHGQFQLLFHHVFPLSVLHRCAPPQGNLQFFAL